MFKYLISATSIEAKRQDIAVGCWRKRKVPVQHLPPMVGGESEEIEIPLQAMLCAST